MRTGQINGVSAEAGSASSSPTLHAAVPDNRRGDSSGPRSRAYRAVLGGGVQLGLERSLASRGPHKLFDLGLVTVIPNYRVKVSPAIRERFENGRDY
ncbi:MAG TPA: hypothetical protein VMI31_19005 [Fimbriimonadaceae bacterium]|nr:hypothetical protein [Fimbriimonadaceae bacterium]